jgi:hypothetical protein
VEPWGVRYTKYSGLELGGGQGHWEVVMGIGRWSWALGGGHLQVEDEPGGGSLADDVHEEVGDGKQPDVGVSQHLGLQVLDHRRLLLVCIT